MKPLKNPARFWNKVDVRGPNDCWNWTACTVRGYGVMWHDGNNKRAPRISYFLTHGELPDDKLVRHTCDNPACVNPVHLVLGTDAENMADRDARGRTARGERFLRSNLTVAAVSDILSSSSDARALAARYGVNDALIYRIRRGDIWKHVPRPDPATLPRLNPAPETVRTCTKCHVEKPIEAFRPAKRYRGGRARWCVACDQAYHRAWNDRRSRAADYLVGAVNAIGGKRA